MSSDGSTCTVLCTGARSGYLASFIIREAASDAHIRLVGTTRSPVTASPSLVTLRYDTADEISAAAATLLHLRPATLIHAAALSSPASCERDEGAAAAANCPAGLIDAIERAEAAAAAEASSHPWTVRLVYVSTDQVYPGDVSDNAEVAALPPPVNAYGRSKLAFEALLAERRGRPAGGGPPRAAVLRASNMIGPPSPATGEGRFLQWLDGVLACAVGGKARQVGLYGDEVRSFVYVVDVARWALAMASVEHLPDCGDGEVSVYNAGGAEALSRVEFGRRVCAVRGIDPEKVIREEKRADVIGGAYPSPLDIGMDIAKIVRDFGDTVRVTPMEVALKDSLGII